MNSIAILMLLTLDGSQPPIEIQRFPEISMCENAARSRNTIPGTRPEDRGQRYACRTFTPFRD